MFFVPFPEGLSAGPRIALMLRLYSRTLSHLKRKVLIKENKKAFCKTEAMCAQTDQSNVDVCSSSKKAHSIIYNFLFY
jgi:hypothetical protein